MPTDRIERDVNRSPRGILGVVGCALAAVALPIFGAYKEANPEPVNAEVTYVTLCDGRRVAQEPRKPLDPTMFTWFGVAMGVAAVVVEMKVRKQLHLARHGLVVEAIVDEVHTRRTRHDTNWFKYGFFIDAGSRFTGKCRVDEIDIMAVSRGTRVNVFYDPENPKCNIPEIGLWAVHWTPA